MGKKLENSSAKRIKKKEAFAVMGRKKQHLPAARKNQKEKEEKRQTEGEQRLKAQQEEKRIRDLERGIVRETVPSKDNKNTTSGIQVVIPLIVGSQSSAPASLTATPSHKTQVALLASPPTKKPIQRTPSITGFGGVKSKLGSQPQGSSAMRPLCAVPTSKPLASRVASKPAVVLKGWSRIVSGGSVGGSGGSVGGSVSWANNSGGLSSSGIPAPVVHLTQSLNKAEKNPENEQKENTPQVIDLNDDSDDESLSRSKKAGTELMIETAISDILAASSETDLTAKPVKPPISEVLADRLSSRANRATSRAKTKIDEFMIETAVADIVAETAFGTASSDDDDDALSSESLPVGVTASFPVTDASAVTTLTEVTTDQNNSSDLKGEMGVYDDKLESPLKPDGSLLKRMPALELIDDVNTDPLFESIGASLTKPFILPTSGFGILCASLTSNAGGGLPSLRNRTAMNVPLSGQSDQELDIYSLRYEIQRLRKLIETMEQSHSSEISGLNRTILSLESERLSERVSSEQAISRANEAMRHSSHEITELTNALDMEQKKSDSVIAMLKTSNANALVAMNSLGQQINDLKHSNTQYQPSIAPNGNPSVVNNSFLRAVYPSFAETPTTQDHPSTNFALFASTAATSHIVPSRPKPVLC